MPLRILATRLGTSVPRSVPHTLSKTAQRSASSSSRSPVRNVVSSSLLLVGGVALVAYYHDSRSLLHEKVAMPIVRLFDAEQGHQLAVRLLSNKWLRPRDKGQDGVELKAEVGL